MSNRERWVVYPLLFLAIGMAMHNQIELSQDVSQVIRCKKLEIMGADSEPAVTISTATSGEAIVQATAADGTPVTLRFAHQAEHLVLLVSDALNQHVHPLFMIPTKLSHAEKSASTITPGAASDVREKSTGDAKAEQRD